MRGHHTRHGCNHEQDLIQNVCNTNTTSNLNIEIQNARNSREVVSLGFKREQGPSSNANSCVKRHQCVTYCRLFTLDVTYPQDESWCLTHLKYYV